MTLSKFVPAWPEGAFALRLVVAALLALWAGTYLPGGHSFSAVISALLVVRPYQQGAFKAGALRLLATAGGIALAFAAAQLQKFGLNDSLRLLLALGPLSLVAAYNSSYRTALIAAVLVLAAPAADEAVHMAIARGVVVTLGAAIGTAVSVIVLPSPHKHVVAQKALKIVGLMVASLTASAEAPTAKTDKAEADLRRSLLELGQMARDNSRNHRDDDESGRIIRLTRHMQALVVLLRAQWRRSSPDAAWCARLAETVAAIQKRKPAELKPLYQDLPETMPEAWLMRALADDVAGLSRLCASV